MLIRKCPNLTIEANRTADKEKYRCLSEKVRISTIKAKTKLIAIIKVDRKVDKKLGFRKI